MQSDILNSKCNKIDMKHTMVMFLSMELGKQGIKGTFEISSNKCIYVTPEKGYFLKFDTKQFCNI